MKIFTDFSTDFHEILQALISSDEASTSSLKMSLKNIL